MNTDQNGGSRKWIVSPFFLSIFSLVAGVFSTRGVHYHTISRMSPPSPRNFQTKTQSRHLLLFIAFCTFLSIADAFQSLAKPRFPASFFLEAEKREEDDSDLLSTLEDNFNYDGRILAPDADFRCGFVSLIGAANMGKSTLLNALLEENLCTTTHRPQTTRHAILGVLTSEEQKIQLCFQDTPGVIEDPAYKLQEGMMEAVQGAFKDSDVILIITDVFSTPIPDDNLFRKLNLADKRKIVIINKIDLADKASNNPNAPQKYHNVDDEDAEIMYKRTVTVEDAVQNWRELVPDALAIIPIIASNGPDDVGVKTLKTLLYGGPDVPAAFRHLGRPIPGMFLPDVKYIDDESASKIIPKGPPLYDPDTLTDRTER